MYYVVLDPTQSYPLEMIAYLGRFGLKALALFSDRNQHNTYVLHFRGLVGEYVAGEFLKSDFGSYESMAAHLLASVDDEICGIIPWEEYTIEEGAYLGELLRVDWNSVEVIRRFRNKYQMKQVLRETGAVPINASEVVGSVAAGRAFVAALGTWPVVVKPTAAAGSRGVYFAETQAELEVAIEGVLEAYPEVLLEEFISGTEYVVNGLTDAHGQLLVTDMWRYDKRDVGPIRNVYFETVKVSTFEPEWLPLAVYATNAVHALGLRKAPVHMELKLNDGGPCMVEVGARFAGGNQPKMASALHGRSLFELAAAHYLGDGVVRFDDVDHRQYDRQHARIISGVQTENLPQISRVLGVDEVSALDSFFGIGKLLSPGWPAPITRDVMTRSYEVYLLHPDPEVVTRDARWVRALIRYE